MTKPARTDDSPDDLTVYDLAERVSSGLEQSSAAYREIATELCRVREEIRLLRVEMHKDKDDDALACQLDELAASMGLL